MMTVFGHLSEDALQNIESNITVPFVRMSKSAITDMRANPT
jgi:hypothetical protein